MNVILKGTSDLENIDLHRVAGGTLRRVSAVPPSRRVRRAAVLVPMRSLSVSPFLFPFGSVMRVREALRLQTLPFLSCAPAGGMELFPTVLERTPRSSSGVVWYASAAELDFPEPPAGLSTLVWPAPLPLVSRVGGTGVTLWADEENLCSLLWSEGRPVLCRWRSRSAGSAESEFAWYDRYCRAQELERGDSFALDATDPKDLESLGGIVRESLARYPWIGTVNLSRTALEGAVGLERAVRLLTRVAGWALLLGVLVLTGGVLKWYQARGGAETARLRSEALYREAFDAERTGRIANPVTLARDRIAELRGNDAEGRSLEDALAELGSVFSENPSMDVTLDVLRYNAEGLDCTGSAPDMSTVLTFRKAWEGRAALSQLDNTQSVPGLGYRFDLRVRW